jgi:hypothetical protein
MSGIFRSAARRPVSIHAKTGSFRPPRVGASTLHLQCRLLHISAQPANDEGSSYFLLALEKIMAETHAEAERLAAPFRVGR